MKISSLAPFFALLPVTYPSPCWVTISVIPAFLVLKLYRIVSVSYEVSPSLNTGLPFSTPQRVFDTVGVHSTTIQIHRNNFRSQFDVLIIHFFRYHKV